MKNEPITYKTKLGTRIYDPGSTTYVIRQDLKEGEEDRQKIKIQDQARRQETDITNL